MTTTTRRWLVEYHIGDNKFTQQFTASDVFAAHDAFNKLNLKDVSYIKFTELALDFA